MDTNGNTAQAPEPQPPAAVGIRPGRALIGWMRPEQALAMLSGSPNGAQATQDQRDQVARAREMVATRPQETPAIEEATQLNPPVLGAIGQRLMGHPSMQAYVNEGWQISMVNLAAVRSFQGHIVTDHAAERVGDPDPDDLDQLAGITLPLIDQFQLPVTLDAQGRAWLITSADHNVRVLGPYFGQPSPDAPPVLGFHVAPLASLLLVVEYNGGLYLRDGYHRATGLLTHGITDVPALVLKDASYDDLRVPQGMLPHDAFLGDRPPYLPDFLDAEVSADAPIPASDKLVMVQALELNPSQLR